MKMKTYRAMFWRNNSKIRGITRRNLTARTLHDAYSRAKRIADGADGVMVLKRVECLG